MWDEDAQDWFAFEIIPVGVSTDQYQALILGSDNLPFLDLRSIGLGGTTSAVNKINSKLQDIKAVLITCLMEIGTLDLQTL